MTCLRGEQGGGNRFQVAHFADQDDVRILAKCSAQGGGEVRGIYFDLALVDEAFLVAVQKLDRVFDGDDVVGALGVDAVDHRRQRRRLARPGGTGDQHHAALLLADAIDHARQVQLV